MALASQSARYETMSHMSSVTFKSPRRRRKQRIMLAALSALVLIGGGSWALMHFGGPARTEGATNDADTAGGGLRLVSDAEANTLAKAKKSVARGSPKSAPGAKSAEPVVMEMGTPPPAPAPANPPGGDPSRVVDPLAKSSPVTETAPPKPATSTQSQPLPSLTPPPGTREDAPAEVQQLMAQAERAAKDNHLVEARSILNGALASGAVREADREGIRRWMAELNETLVFSPNVAAGDPFSETYRVASGDSLVKIVGKKGLAVETQLIQRINKISDPNRLRQGQPLKLVRGPFHAVVHKADFRLDLYAGNPIPPGSAGKGRTDGSEDGWTYIRSFPVGLGTEGGTPTGTFLVRQGSKLRNPAWANPRTGEKFDADDPKNPIGEHWLGLQSTDGQNKEGYGLHGTIDPDSIGKEKSMGCVRMNKEDIALIWEMLEDGVSTVRIMP